MRRIFKFATGQEVPEGAIFLSTITNGEMDDVIHRKFVWHYFLVEDLK